MCEAEACPLVQSLRLWFEKLKAVLESAGFTGNDYDVCVFNKSNDGIQTTVAFHVDDLLVSSVSNADIDSLMSVLRDNY